MEAIWKVVVGGGSVVVVVVVVVVVTGTDGIGTGRMSDQGPFRPSSLMARTRNA